MEPELRTDPGEADILEELKVREPIFHRPELGCSRSDFEAMMAADFWEVGASGRRYSREFVLEELERRYSGPLEDSWKTRDFHCRRLCAQVYLLSYTLEQGARITRRATVWNRSSSGWKIVFHQGTVVQDQ